MVPDEDCGTHGVEVVVRVVDREGYPGEAIHDVFVGACGCPLCYAVEADKAEDEGGEDSIGGADYEGEEGGEEAGEETRDGEAGGEHEEEDGEAEGGVDGEEEVVEESGHGGVIGLENIYSW